MALNAINEERLTKTMVYLRAKTLSNRWQLLNDEQKKYAAYLVKTYGYPVMIAVQQAYLIGYDSWPYDYKAGHVVTEATPRETFGF